MQQKLIKEHLDCSEKKELRKRMYQYVIPAVISYLVLGIYVFVDAVFVGNKIGELGIAAINTAFSIISISQAVGSGIGIGASVKYTILRAQGKEKEAQDYAGGAFKLILIFGAFLTLALSIFSKQIMRLLGASEKIAEIGEVYLRVQGISAYVMLFAENFIALSRNNGGSRQNMLGVTAGCLSNCFFDWLMIYKLNWGMFGASFASVLGQVVTLLFALTFLIKNKITFTKCPRGRFKEVVPGILRNAITPFAIIFVPNITVIITNHACLKYGGDRELSIYGIVSFLVYCVYMIIQGITDGSQPLISEYKGKQQLGKYTFSSNLVFRITLFFAVACGLFELLLRRQLVVFMGASDQIINDCSKVLSLLTIGFVFLSVSRTIAAVFYASERNYMAYAISFTEPVFLSIFLLIFCPIFKNQGIWYSYVAAQFGVCVLASVLVSISRINIKKWF